MECASSSSGGKKSQSIASSSSSTLIYRESGPGNTVDSAKNIHSPYTPETKTMNAVDLAELAAQLDAAERAELEDDNNSSHNVNETGNFSVQVISQALAIWSLELVPFLQQSPEADRARTNPENQRAFICNLQSHWFTIRRFGDRWFDLNSIMSKPRFVSTTYLTIYLAQLQHEGQSIFFVAGQLPDSEADQLFTLCPPSEAVLLAAARESPRTNNRRSRVDDDDSETQETIDRSEAELDEENVTLQRVLAESRSQAQQDEVQLALQLSASLGDEQNLEEAIKLSLTADGPNPAPIAPNPDDLRQKRLAYFNKLQDDNK